MSSLSEKLFGHHDYSRVSSSSNNESFQEDTRPPTQPSTRGTTIAWAVTGALLCWLCGLAAGLTIGWLNFHTAPNTSDVSLSGNITSQVPLAKMRQSVHADPAFEAPPNRTEGTEPVWDSLIPDGLGYVKNPELAPNLSVIGAFHQLHCLYIVRRAYYDNEPSDLHHSRRSDFDVGVDRHPHVGHCFDYLRQSLQCASDSNLEPVGERVVGNPNWGFDRQCRDFEGLKAWAEEWAAVDIPGTFIPDIFKSHHH